MAGLVASYSPYSPQTTSPRPNLHALPLALEGETRLVFNVPAQVSSLSATVFIFLFLNDRRTYHNSFAALSCHVHHGGFSERYLQLPVRALGVRLVHSVLSHTCISDP